MTGDFLAEKSGAKINRIKYNALTASATVGGNRVFLLKPQTFMNLSGNPTRQAMNYLRLPIENVVVVSDDVSLPMGKLRIRRSGSSGGHNGLKDIIAKCGGEGFPRIKIGVGAPPHKDYEMMDWVLAKLSSDDEKLLKSAAQRAAEALVLLITDGVDRAMLEYN